MQDSISIEEYREIASTLRHLGHQIDNSFDCDGEVLLAAGAVLDKKIETGEFEEGDREILNQASMIVSRIEPN